MFWLWLQMKGRTLKQKTSKNDLNNVTTFFLVFLLLIVHRWMLQNVIKQISKVGIKEINVYFICTYHRDIFHGEWIDIHTISKIQNIIQIKLADFFFFFFVLQVGFERIMLSGQRCATIKLNCFCGQRCAVVIQFFLVVWYLFTNLLTMWL